jgi:hypothetical protein
MSQVYPVLNGFVGYGSGDILLNDNVPLDSEHPVVKARPELFVPAELEETARRGPGRPPGAKNKPKPAVEDEGTDG